MSAHLYSSGGHQHAQVWKKSFSPFRIVITRQRPLGAVQRLSYAAHALNNVHKRDQALLREWCIGMCLLYRGARTPHDHHAHILTSSPRSPPTIALGSSHH